MDDLPKSLKIWSGGPQWVSRGLLGQGPPAPRSCHLKGMVLLRIPWGQQLVTLQEAT